MRNLNWLAEKITLLGNKLNIPIEESIFFIQLFQRKPDSCNMGNNGSERNVTTFKTICNFKKSNNKESPTYSQAQTF